MVTCPQCGNQSPWNPPARTPAMPVPFDEIDPVARRGIRVRCLARPPGVSRQMRREAERSGQPIVCGAIFVVRPLPPDDEQAIDNDRELPDPDQPPTKREMSAGLNAVLLAAALSVAPRGGR